MLDINSGRQEFLQIKVTKTFTDVWNKVAGFDIGKALHLYLYNAEMVQEIMLM